MPLTQQQAKQAFRYLKRGVFPPTGIEHFTAGRTSETRAIRDLLKDTENAVSRHCFLEASYGYGKSHMLKVAESLALQNQFAVTWVTINGDSHAFNHPTRYLHKLFENLSAPGIPDRGLCNICQCWFKNSEKEPILKWANTEAPWALRYSLNNFAREVENGQAANSNDGYHRRVLEARDLNFCRGKSYHPEAYERIAALGRLSRAAGLAGTLFLFDEMETVATLLTNVRSRLLAYEVLNQLVDSRRFPYCVFLFATTLDFDERLRLETEHYACYENDYPDGFRFAKKWRSSDINILPLKPISKADNLNLLRNLRAAHQLAYDWPADQRIPDEYVQGFLETATQNSLTEREITKSFVDILETAQQHPDFMPLNPDRATSTAPHASDVSAPTRQKRRSSCHQDLS